MVREIRPRWVVAENVPGIINIAADEVCTSLEREGYSVGIWDYEALAVGAPHRRERVFLWRTPDAHCDRGFRKRETFERRMERGMPIQLNDQVAHIAQTPIKGGSLNPEWVEWLMGLPIGWAEV